MQHLTTTEFARILQVSAGGDAAAVSNESLDIPFGELGYDSLALLETIGQIEREHGVAFSDDILGEATTPRSFLALVNDHLATAVRV
ncbi:acyl carrier protein [Actinokineospora sp.]|uniref:acyl carrier protein n=1 Tax=Actinokineospora sp. TaxID=1872133 RepID=UPI004037EF23